MLNVNSASIEYSAATKLLDLAEKIADTRNTKKRDKYLDQAATILYYLEAVSYKTTYLEDDVVNNIYQCLIDISEIQDYPVVPALPQIDVPDVGTTIIIEGTPGPQGADGGGTDFSELNVTSDTVVDDFLVSDAYAARWDYIVNGTAQRAGSIIATWLEDGSNLDLTKDSTNDVNGATSAVSFTVSFSGGDIRLNAIVTSGTWNISGSRYFIPNNGAFTAVTNQLADGKIYIGNTSNTADQYAVSGDITMTNLGVASISNGVIVNADVNASAAIAVSKLAALTASRGVVTDGSGFLTTSAATATEVGYLSGVSSAIQTQLDGKIGSVTGAISTVVSSDLTTDRMVISNPAGKIAVSGASSTEGSYLIGVTSAIQTQLNAKQATITGGATTITSSNLTASKVLVSDGSGKVAASSIGASELVAVASGTTPLAVKMLSIGDWNMDSDTNKAVAHGIGDYTTIRYAMASVRDDPAGAVFQPLNKINFVSGVMNGGVVSWDATNINLARLTSGDFDNTSYDATSYNRGWVIIYYTA